MKVKHALLPVLIAFLLIIQISWAQPKSRYILRSIKLEFLDGTHAKGQLLYARADSLVMNGIGKLAPGCHVRFRVQSVSTDQYGRVEAITDSTLTIRLADAPETPYIIRRNQIKSISVIQAAEGGDPNTVFLASSIKSIRMGKKNAVGTGFLIGGLLGGLLFGVLIPTPDATWSSLGINSVSSKVEDVIIGVVVGGTFGAVINSMGKKYPINGDPTAFDVFVKKLYH